MQSPGLNNNTNNSKKGGKKAILWVQHASVFISITVMCI